jgi:hypothetical protein
VRSVVVADQMDLVPAVPGVDGIKEGEELHVRVSRKASTEDTAACNLEGSEQTRGPMSLVVMRPALGKSGKHRQKGLSPIQSLDLGLLVHAQDNGLFGRIQVEPNYIRQLLLEGWILAELERRRSVRLKPVLVPDSSDRGRADFRFLCQRSGAPAGRVGCPRGSLRSGDRAHRRAEFESTR